MLLAQIPQVSGSLMPRLAHHAIEISSRQMKPKTDNKQIAEAASVMTTIRHSQNNKFGSDIDSQTPLDSHRQYTPDPAMNADHTAMAIPTPLLESPDIRLAILANDSISSIDVHSEINESMHMEQVHTLATGTKKQNKAGLKINIALIVSLV